MTGSENDKRGLTAGGPVQKQSLPDAPTDRRLGLPRYPASQVLSKTVIPAKRSAIYRLRCQAAFAWLQGSPERTMALSVTMSFRITAVMTTLLGLPLRLKSVGEERAA